MASSSVGQIPVSFLLGIAAAAAAMAPEGRALSRAISDMEAFSTNAEGIPRGSALQIKRTAACGRRECRIEELGGSYETVMPT